MNNLHTIMCQVHEWYVLSYNSLTVAFKNHKATDINYINSLSNNNNMLYKYTIHTSNQQIYAIKA